MCHDYRRGLNLYHPYDQRSDSISTNKYIHVMGLSITCTLMTTTNMIRLYLNSVNIIGHNNAEIMGLMELQNYTKMKIALINIKRVHALLTTSLIVTFDLFKS